MPFTDQGSAKHWAERRGVLDVEMQHLVLGARPGDLSQLVFISLHSSYQARLGGSF
jgi:hypothetical protein